MKTHPGVAADMFDALADAGINIEIISTSPIRISCVVRAGEIERAVQVVHDRFRLADPAIEWRRTGAAEARGGSTPAALLRPTGVDPSQRSQQGVRSSAPLQSVRAQELSSRDMERCLERRRAPSFG